jgi:RNA polymerase sigma factor (sigma-70 family)
MVKWITSSKEILVEPPPKVERTRYGYVNRLERAIHAAVEESLLPGADSTLKEAATNAKRLWDEAAKQEWEFVLHFVRIAIGEAKKFSFGSVRISDLTQEGLIGLRRAVKRFDPERGLRFSSYARWWVRAQMFTAVRKTAYLIPLPAKANEQLVAIHRLMAQWTALGLDFTFADVAFELGIDPARIHLLEQSRSPVSLEVPDPQTGTPLREKLETLDGVDRPDQVLCRRQEAQFARELVGSLPERHRFVLEELYGDQEPSRADVGRTLEISRERVRQIEAKALSRLRHQAKNC